MQLTDAMKDMYTLWTEKAVADPDLKAELNNIRGNDEEIYERFYRELEFGTAGLRGIIGAGTNRLNVYTICKATQGLADFLNATCENPSVAIGYDSRNKSDQFSKAAAEVLAANGVKTYIFSELMPTPMLSYALGALKCDGGIIVTASHNPSKYNGFKCYGGNGYQMTDDEAAEVYGYISKLNLFEDIKWIEYDTARENGLVEIISQSVLDGFYEAVLGQRIHSDIYKETTLKVVYTPLNGAGNKPVREVLKRAGNDAVTVVKEQENPDGSFSTCPFPNPEIRQTFELALELAKTVQPDLLLATDPDCDRVGIAVPDGQDYRLMSGNEVGCLLLEYILSSRKEKGILPKNPMVVKTIVTTELAARIAEKYGCTLVNVLTGFKYIGEQIGILEEAGEPERYVFGFEESYGYLVGTHCRDKDAVVASLLICEMAAYYKTKGLSLLDVMENLYQEYGNYLSSVENFEFEGAAGMVKMQDLMTSLRENPPIGFAGYAVVRRCDYQESVDYLLESGEETAIALPKSNVLSYFLEGGNGVIVRPSGTEPKIKAYITAVGKNLESARRVCDELSKAAKNLLSD